MLAVRAIPLVIYEAVLILTAMGVVAFLEEYRMIVVAVAVFAGIFCSCLVLMDYLTAGIAVDERVLRTADGFFGKTLVAVRYDKIQYVELKQNLPARLCGIQKGSFSLLAAVSMREHDIPYFRMNLEEKIKRKNSWPVIDDKWKSEVFPIPSQSGVGK